MRPSGGKTQRRPQQSEGTSRLKNRAKLGEPDAPNAPDHTTNKKQNKQQNQIDKMSRGRRRESALIAIAETTKLLLAGGVPDLEDNFAIVGVEGQRMNLDTLSR